ncbi:hypothetical protein T492DRAFT_1089549 [Pavlovales sp. CCMP2436]|nr:hypothetical protein T492DRAFT_1089549 [Pavlovales sp. CCMP2436]
MSAVGRRRRSARGSSTTRPRRRGNTHTHTHTPPPYTHAHEPPYTHTHTHVHTHPPYIHTHTHPYTPLRAHRYSSAAERTGIQRDLTERSLHLLYSLTRWDGRPRLLADIGCGAGASSSVARRCGHRVIGLDVSLSMLAAGEPHEEAVCWEMGRGLPFRDGVQLDGAISISALQWLCSDVLEPKLRLLLSHLHSSLRPGAAAVAQFYPGSPAETARLVRCAAEAGWAADGGGAAAVYDLPHANRSSRLFLCLERGEGEVGR